VTAARKVAIHHKFAEGRAGTFAAVTSGFRGKGMTDAEMAETVSGL